MVTDTACRWLLADEVGLGKTIQALMVLRALATQRETGLRVALVVPDDLVQQWQYLATAVTEGRNVRQDLVLQVAGRSPASLINRASTLGRGASSKLLAVVKALDEAARDPGDAKLDALIDHLRRAFAVDPNSRILVVAEDRLSSAFMAPAKVSRARRTRSGERSSRSSSVSSATSPSSKDGNGSS